MANHDRESDWARQVPERWRKGPYRDYGWESGQSGLPEFRDPEVHLTPEEWERVREWRRKRQEGFFSIHWGWESPGPFSGLGPRGYRRSNQRIFEDVCERLTQNGQIDASDIEIEVKDGEVYLKGTVGDRRTKRLAEDIAESVTGVRDVHNQLRLSGLPGGGAGRIEKVEGSGVYPASGPLPESDAEVQGMASWGQGERGAEGYEDR